MRLTLKYSLNEKMTRSCMSAIRKKGGDDQWQMSQKNIACHTRTQKGKYERGNANLRRQ